MKVSLLRYTVPKMIWVGLGLLLFSNVPIYSQATGFMGQRFFLEGQVGPSIILNFKDNFNRVRSSGEKGVALAQGLSFNMVTSRNNYLSLSFDNRNFYLDIDDFFLDSGRNSLRFNTQIQTYGLAYSASRSKRGYAAPLAPLGRIFGYKVTYHRLSSKPTKYTDSGDALTDADLEIYNLAYVNPKASFVGIAMIVGYRTIVKDKITLFITGELGTIAKVDPDYYSNNRERPFEASQLNYYLGNYLNINLGAGYLLF